jgi:hypothetical protein
MIFQTEYGSLIIINKCDYKNDYIYYKKIYDFMKEINNASK